MSESLPFASQGTVSDTTVTKKTDSDQNQNCCHSIQACFRTVSVVQSFQKDFGTYLRQNRSSQVAIETARIIGDSVSSQVIGNSEEEVSAKHDELLEEFFQHAVDNECLLVAVTDDFHTCHSWRRPTSEQTSVNNPMCTIVIMKFPTIKAVLLQEDANNPEGINIEKVSQFITSIQNMKIITQQTYASSMPAWLKEQFFQPENEQ